MDILVQPMQRLTKYGLLLKAILKNTDEEVERDSLEHMVSMQDRIFNIISCLRIMDNYKNKSLIKLKLSRYGVNYFFLFCKLLSQV